MNEVYTIWMQRTPLCIKDVHAERLSLQCLILLAEIMLPLARDIVQGMAIL